MQTLSVLLIEDDQATRQSLADVLEQEHYRVVQAADGEAGLAAFEQHRPDIIVSDLKMPKTSGLDVLRAVKETHPSVPFILMTAYGETDVAVEALRLGALDYFKKPIELDELLTALGRAREVVFRARSAEDFPTVLLAEDDEVTREHLADVFEKESYVVLATADGQEALDRFKTEKVDIVLLDIKMPKLDGLSALSAMREHRDDFEAIILTGFGDESSAIRALRDGAMSFIRKPIDLEELLVTVEKAAQKLSLARSLRYRTREVELAHQIIAQLAEDEQIMVRLSDAALQRTRDVVAHITDHLTDCVAVLDGERRVRFANRRFATVFGQAPTRFDEAFVADLAAKSGGGLAADEVGQTMAAALQGAIGTPHVLEASATHSLLCVKARARTVGVARDYLFVHVRGLQP